MSALKLEVEGIQDVAVGTTRLHVEDPGSKLRSIAFYVTDAAGTRTGPVSPDRSMPRLGIYERDVGLHPDALVRVQAVATLTDGSTLDAEEVAFGQRGVTPARGTIESLRMPSVRGRVEVGVTLGSATTWKCWGRRGTWPTTDGSPGGHLLDDFLRFEGDPALTWFDTAANAGDEWYAVAVGYNSAGEPGSRMTASVLVAP